MQLNRTVFVILYKIKGFWEKLLCNSVHIFRFVDQLLLVNVLSNLCQQKTTTKADFRYKSLKSWNIDNIDLTQQFSLSIFTDFRYQSIKITWLQPTMSWKTWDNKNIISWILKHDILVVVPMSCSGLFHNFGAANIIAQLPRVFDDFTGGKRSKDASHK